MGLFSKKDSAKADDKKINTSASSNKDVKKEDSKPQKSEKGVAFDSGSVIKNPRITEKAAYAADRRVYTFDVFPRATKLTIEKAIKEIYKVTPVKVNIVAIPKKSVYRKNSIGTKGGGKKAYVYLKKGDKIDFV